MRWMHWWFTAPLRLRSILLRRSVEQELDEELQFHLDNKIAEGIADGLSTKEARYRALRAMDGLEQRKEEMRDTRRIHWLTDFVDDARYAIRSLRRTPGFTVFVALTLALGIGITSGVFPLFDGLVLRPYPVPHPGGVVTLVSTTHDNSFGDFSYREYLDIRGATKSYDGVIANAGMEAVGFSAEPGATPRVKGGMLVSGNYFRVLGVEPRLGRSFREDEDSVAGRDAVVVLGPDFWRTEFASSPAVLGRRIRLNGVEFTVIGVAPESFTGMQVFTHPDFYMPLAMAGTFSTDPLKNFFEDRDDRELNVKARLKPGVPLGQARSELAELANNFERAYPDLNHKRGAAVRTDFEMRTRNDQGEWKFSVIFFVLALSVLLVACTNVAGLLLGRARTRKREIAIRLAIGAGRFRLIRLLLTESLILASLGGLAGIAFGNMFVRALSSFKVMSDLPVTVPVEMNTRVLVGSLALTVLSALLCGLAPALQSTRTDLVSGLKSADADVPGRKRLWGRNALVVAQVSASLMLLAASFLMVRGFQHSWSEGPGFRKDHLLMARFDPRLLQYNLSQTERFYKLLGERVRVAPGVQAATLTENIPMGQGNLDSIDFVPEGFEMPRDRKNFSSALDIIDDGYFATMGIPILSGRGFISADNADAPRVAVVSEQFAKHYWPNVDAVGKHIRLDSRGGTPVEIVGVARGIKYRSSSDKPADFVYVPMAQHPVEDMFLLLRSSGDPLELIATVKNAVKTPAPNLPVFETRSYEDYYDNWAVEGPLFAVDLVSTMGGVGLLLAIAGLYGLVAYNVSRRTREIGIRMALGAVQWDVLRLVMRQGLMLVSVGIAAGIVMGLGVEQVLDSLIFAEAGRVDIVAYLILVPAMFLVTMLAAYIPARRASRIAPTQALRYE